MKKVLVTGATGNIGIEVIRSLSLLKHQLQITAAIRDLKKDKDVLAGNKVDFILFDFTDITTYAPALKNCDILFLLRPPQISEVEKYFKPLIGIAKDEGVKHIIFLSVQGVEKSKLIPHHKIEKLIICSKISYTFLRPAYFMQNFTTNLRNDLIIHHRIFLPAGNVKFTLVDVLDIGEVAARVIVDISKHTNKVYELTSNEKLSFKAMAGQLSEVLQVDIQYISPNLLNYFIVKRKEKTPVMLILVMIMLHYLPRFQKEFVLTNTIEKILGKQPITFKQFIVANQNILLKQ